MSGMGLQDETNLLVLAGLAQLAHFGLFPSARSLP
jgi:hypothetical protein